ncbi:unnamed protein product [Camellia sinensis]
MNHFEREEGGDEPVLNLQGCLCSVLKSVTLQLSLCSSTQNLSAASDLFTSSTEVLLLGKDIASWGRYTLGKLPGEDTPLGSYPYPPQQNYPWPPQQHGPKYNTRWVNTQYPMTRTPIAA